MVAPEPALKQVGRYAVGQKIAAGGMASVHLGRLLGPVGFSRTVAIKSLHARYAGDRQFVKMLIDEARLAARIRHPNVASVVDVVTTGQEFLLVMEYVHGESLAKLMKLSASPVPPRVAVAILAGSLHGLHAAHEAKTEHGERLDIVHRDVSPHNILVGVDGMPRVADFGIAKAAVRLHQTQAGELKGKLAYMAPEQIDGESVDRRTDVYAAGVVLWETLTGRRLFQTGDALETVRRVMANQVPPPSSLTNSVPRGIDDVVLRAVARAKEARFTNAREMAIQLERALPAASAAEVAEWVESVAAESLEQRAREVAGLERTTAQQGRVESPFESVPADAQDFAKTLFDPNAGPPPEAGDASYEGSAPMAAVVTDDDGTTQIRPSHGGTDLSAAAPSPLAARSRTPLWALFLPAAVLSVGAMLVIARPWAWRSPAPPVQTASPAQGARVTSTDPPPMAATAPSTQPPAGSAPSTAPSAAPSASASAPLPTKRKPASGGARPAAPAAPMDEFGDLSRQ